MAIQCKHYSKAVGNRAVQEVAAGVQFYEAHYAVVSNALYTAAAQEFANKLRVALLHHEEIMRFDVLFLVRPPCVIG